MVFVHGCAKVSSMDEPKRGRGRPKSPDTDPTTGRRGRVLGLQVDDAILELIDMEVELMKGCGHTMTRSDACRAMLRRAGANPPDLLLQMAENTGQTALIERYKAIRGGVAAPGEASKGDEKPST